MKEGNRNIKEGEKEMGISSEEGRMNGRKDGRKERRWEGGRVGR